MALDLSRWKKDYKEREKRKSKDDKLFLWPLEKGKVGKFFVRLLPTTKEIVTHDHLGWEVKAVHNLGKTVRNYVKKVPCLNYHGNENCPICDLGSALYNTDSEEYREVGKSLFSVRHYIYNALIYDKNHKILHDGLPMKIYLPRTIQEGGRGRGEDNINNFIMKYGDIFDVMKGRDILFKVEMGSFGPNYKDIDIQEPSPVTRSKSELKKILSNLNDLKFIVGEVSRADYCDQLKAYFTLLERDDILDIMKKSGFKGATVDASSISQKNDGAIDDDDDDDDVIDDDSLTDLISDGVSDNIDDDLLEDIDSQKKETKKTKAKKKPKTKKKKEPEKTEEDDEFDINDLIGDGDDYSNSMPLKEVKEGAKNNKIEDIVDDEAEDDEDYLDGINDMLNE